MKIIALQRVLLSVLVISVAACSGSKTPGSESWFGGNVISVAESKIANPNAPSEKYAASIRLLPYVDARNTGNANKIGISTQLVIGMSGTELIVDPAVSAIVTNSMRKHLDDAGYRLDETNGLFELGGVVKVLNYDVKTRDEISIEVESTLKELATGKAVWSGVVVEKSDRFAGVSGNSKKDIANYLREKVAVVTGKTTEAISASLMASRPDLFNLTPGTRPIQGVTVLTVPAASVVPAGQNMAPAVSSSDAVASGLLLLTSTPARVKIYIDEVYYGLTPLRLELAPGVHKVSAKLAGYKTSVEKVAVRKAETTEMEMTLQR